MFVLIQVVVYPVHNRINNKHGEMVKNASLNLQIVLCVANRGLLVTGLAGGG